MGKALPGRRERRHRNSPCLRSGRFRRTDAVVPDAGVGTGGRLVSHTAGDGNANCQSAGRGRRHSSRSTAEHIRRPAHLHLLRNNQRVGGRGTVFKLELSRSVPRTRWQNAPIRLIVLLGRQIGIEVGSRRSVRVPAIRNVNVISAAGGDCPGRQRRPAGKRIHVHDGGIAFAKSTEIR